MISSPSTVDPCCKTRGSAIAPSPGSSTNRSMPGTCRTTHPLLCVTLSHTTWVIAPSSAEPMATIQLHPGHALHHATAAQPVEQTRQCQLRHYRSRR